jgi:O-antigen ligase
MAGIGLVLISLFYFIKKYNLTTYRWRKLIPIIVVSMIFLQMIPTLRSGIVERVSPETYGGWRESLEYREYTTLASLKAFSKNPIIGVGPNNFSPNSHIWLREINAPQIIYGKEAHNAYSELLAELGIIGGALFFFILSMIIKYLLTAIKIFIKVKDYYMFAISISVISISILQIFAHLIGNSVITGFNHFSVPLGFAIGLKSLAQNIDHNLVRQ